MCVCDLQIVVVLQAIHRVTDCKSSDGLLNNRDSIYTNEKGRDTLHKKETGESETRKRELRDRVGQERERVCMLLSCV
jgi:hypothetical protein